MSGDSKTSISKVPASEVRKSVSNISITNPNYREPRSVSDNNPTNLHQSAGSHTSTSPLFLSPVTSDPTAEGGASTSKPRPEGRPVSTENDTESPAIVPISRHTSVSQESLKKVQNPIDSDEEMPPADTTEQTPLLFTNPYIVGPESRAGYVNTQAYQRAGDIPVPLDREKRRRSDSEAGWSSWCNCWQNDFNTTPPHPIPSAFTNETFRQEFVGKVFKVKMVQMVCCFMVALFSQLSWNSKWNEKYGTPSPILLIADHRWITAIPIGVYIILLGYVRFITPQELRKRPLDLIIFILLTIFLSLFTYTISIGFVTLIPAVIVPVTFGSFLWAYYMFGRLVTPDREQKVLLDVTTNKFYYAIIPVICTGTFLMWPIIYTILKLGNSILVGREEVLESLLQEGIPVIGIGGVFLLLDVYHIKGILNGKRISLITEDQTEVMFASFFV